MQVAFFKASAGGLLDHVIDWYSGRLGFSHVELVFNHTREGEKRLCFSSDPHDGGTRFKFIDLSADSWLVLGLPKIGFRATADLYSWCINQAGKKYDWLGVLGFVLPTHPRQKHWFCSEIVTAALQSLGYLGHVPAWKVSPSSLYLMLESESKPLAVREQEHPLPPDYRHLLAN